MNGAKVIPFHPFPCLLAKHNVRPCAFLMGSLNDYCFESFLTTLNNHFDQITNYFINRHNSGFVEGLNNKIKVLKRRCYGLFKRDRAVGEGPEARGARSRGDARCRFLAGAPETLQAVYEGASAGRDYRAVLGG